MAYTPDIVIIGAGIAGLWLAGTLKKQGYDILLLEKNAIGGGQSLASQGIIHSGLKYMLGEKSKEVSETIAAMPARWNEALAKDLKEARVNSAGQQLLIPKGFVGNIVKGVSKRAMKGEAAEIDIPDDLSRAGFKGSLIHMNEAVLDIPSVVRALATPILPHIKKCEGNVFEFLKAHNITPKHIIFTAAGGNADHAPSLKTQKRPLLMGFLRPAPFPLYGHLVGTSDKPVATITTHKDAKGNLVWYLGGQVAEREKDSDPADVYRAIQKAFQKYLPGVDIGEMEFAVLPIDRVEGQNQGGVFMPDTPNIQEIDGVLYCWPTKLAFAPMLSDMVMERLKSPPSNTQSDWTFLEPVDFVAPPWDKVTWRKIEN